MRKILLQDMGKESKIDLHYSAVLKMGVDNDMLCAASPNDYPLFSEAMKLKEFVVTGYARNDIFHRDLAADVAPSA